MVVPSFVFNLLVGDVADNLSVTPYYQYRPDRIMKDVYSNYYYTLAFLRMNQVSFFGVQSGVSLLAYRNQDLVTFSTGGSF
jgi:hypothetical protein